VENGIKPLMITEQYRMHPEISSFPSKSFYESKLVNATIVTSRPIPSPLQHLVDKVPHYAFLDLENSQEDSGGKSYSNINEAKLIVNIVKDMSTTWKIKGFGEENTRSLIGVITPYRKQVSIIRRMLSNEHLDPFVEVNTVDSYQGREKDVIIISTVRAGGRSVGFLMDYRRMNVAITRAKYFLWVVGSSNTLMLDHYWKSFVGNAQARGLIWLIKNEKDTKSLWLDKSTELNPAKKRKLPEEIITDKKSNEKLTARSIRAKLF